MATASTIWRSPPGTSPYPEWTSRSSNGAGGFGPQTLLPVTVPPRSVTIGNFNADTIPDLAVGTASNKISILLGTGGGAFSPQTSYPTVGQPTSLVAANFDGDSDQDLAADGAGQVSVLLNNGSGAFGPPTAFGGGTSGLSDLATSDLNGDGTPDVVRTSESSGAAIFLGDGSGGLASPITFPAGNGPIGVAIGLLNGDSTPDLVTVPDQGEAVLLSVVPQLSINTVAHLEGDTGTTPFTFTVTASSRSVDSVTVDAQTMDGLATAASADYVSLPLQTFAIAPGQSSTNVTVQGNGDYTFEPDEQFFVKLSNPVNAAIAGDTGTGFINNDDQVGYGRPKAATPLSIPLVPGVQQVQRARPYARRADGLPVLQHSDAAFVVADRRDSGRERRGGQLGRVGHVRGDAGQSRDARGRGRRWPPRFDNGCA